MCPEVIIGSPNQNIMAVNNSGAIPIAGYLGGVIYPLLVDSQGRLKTDATVTGSLVIGSVSIDVDTVYVQSGANIDLGSAWTTTGSVYVVNTIDVTQGTNPWIVLGSVYNTSITIIPVSGPILETDDCQMVRAVMTAKKPNDEFINIDATAGGNLKISIEETNGNVILPISGNNLAGSFAITTNPVPVSGVLSVSVGSKTWIIDTIPTNSDRTNPSWKFVYSGTTIGSIYQFIGTGSYVQSVSYSGGYVVGLSPWTSV